jgi:hypothetical protein
MIKVFRAVAMKRACVSCLSVLFSCMVITSLVSAADEQTEKFLPLPECAKGWAASEKVVFYNKENLFERINGEAEIYFPFGFDLLASARYQSIVNPQIAIDADIYRMGSLLDAFGIYAGYRRADDAGAKIGADGVISPSQLLFYQDRYFVRLQATGTLEIDKNIFLACGGAISDNIALNPGKPKELDPFRMPGIEKNSERYMKSLLGYSFLRMGIIADAKSGTEQFQVFIVSEDSEAAARKAFDQYVSYSGPGVRVDDSKEIISMSGIDPLYGKIFLRLSGRYLFGAVRFSDVSVAGQFIGKLLKSREGTK